MDKIEGSNMNNSINNSFVINPMLFQQQTNINMNFNNNNNNMLNQNLLYNQMMQNMNNINQMNQNQNFNQMNQNMMPINQNYNQINQKQNFNQMNQNMMKNNQNFNQMNNVSNMNLVSQIYNNNMNMDTNNFWININQISLLISIIDFYHKTDNEFVDINEKYQIMNIMNRLNPNLSKLKQDNEILDPLHYIKEPKKVAKFINSDFKLFSVKIPSSIDKIDLYSIASSYKVKDLSDILLISNNCIIEKDDSPIDSISDGDLIIILENRTYPDDSYYKSLLTKNKNFRVINVVWLNRYEGILNLQFPSNTTIWQIKKAIYLKFGYHKKEIWCEWFSGRDNETLEEIFHPGVFRLDLSYEKAYQILNYNINLFGKKLYIKIKHKKYVHQLEILLGELNSNKILVRRIESDLQEKVKKIYFNENELNIKDEMSIASLGITDGSVLLVISEEENQ